MKIGVIFTVVAGVWVFALNGISGASEHEILRAELEDLRQKIESVEVLKARVAELEANVAQYATRAVAEAGHHQAHHDHESFSLDLGHQHAHLDIHDMQLHGGLDWRYVDVQGSRSKMFLHEVEIGVSARLADWMEAFISFTKHDGEEVEVEQAYGKFKFEELSMQARVGQFFVNFGLENRAGFFDRRTVTSSAMRAGFFGHENWADQGIEISYGLPFEFRSIITAAVIDGKNKKTFGDGIDEVNNKNFPLVMNWTHILDPEWGEVTLGQSFAYGKWDEDSRYDVYLAGIDAGIAFGNWNFQAEYMYRHKAQMAGVSDIEGYGYYILGSYDFPVRMKYLDSVEMLFAFGQSDPERATKETRYTPQLTFHLTEAAKIRFSYDIRRENPEEIRNNRLIGQFAYHF